MSERSGKMRSLDPATMVPPHDLDAERSVIGALMMSEVAVESVTEILQPEDFYSELHRIIYRACVQIYARGEPIDQLTLTNELRGNGEFEKIGGRPYIFQIVESVPTAANAHRYAHIIKGKSTLRNIIDAGAMIQAEGYKEDEDPQDILDRSEQIVYNIGRGGRASETFVSTEELVGDELEKIQALHEEGAEPAGLSSGFPDLDKIFLGFSEEEIVILAGRTGMGKTSMALSIVQSCSIKRGVPVAIFSLEMSKSQLTKRLISMESSISSELIATGKVPEDEWTKMFRASARIADAPIYINDTAGISVAAMRPKLRRLASRLESRGTPLGLVVVDYVGLMKDEFGAREGREKEVSAVSRGLKTLAREMGLPFLVLAQFNRGADNRHGNRPLISDLRDSGSLEQDADKILMIYRDEYYDPESDDKGIAEIIVGKHRNGPTGVAKLAWVEKLARFSSLQKEG